MEEDEDSDQEKALICQSNHLLSVKNQLTI